MYIYLTYILESFYIYEDLDEFLKKSQTEKQPNTLTSPLLYLVNNFSFVFGESKILFDSFKNNKEHSFVSLIEFKLNKEIKDRKENKDNKDKSPNSPMSPNSPGSPNSPKNAYSNNNKTYTNLRQHSFNVNPNINITDLFNLLEKFGANIKKVIYSDSYDSNKYFNIVEYNNRLKKQSPNLSTKFEPFKYGQDLECKFSDEELIFNSGYYVARTNHELNNLNSNSIAERNLNIKIENEKLFFETDNNRNNSINNNINTNSNTNTNKLKKESKESNNAIRNNEITTNDITDTNELLQGLYVEINQLLVYNDMKISDYVLGTEDIKFFIKKTTKLSNSSSNSSSTDDEDYSNTSTLEMDFKKSPVFININSDNSNDIVFLNNMMSLLINN